MTQQSGYGYNAPTARDQGTGISDEISERTHAAADKMTELGNEALDQVDEWLKPVGLSIREKPMTCLAVVGGMAFAAGAIWMMRSSRQSSQVSDLISQLSSYAKKGW